MLWFLLGVPLGGGLLSVYLAKRLSPLDAVEDDRTSPQTGITIDDLADAQGRQEWEARQTRGLVLELRAGDAETRDQVERDLGDVRRSVNSIQNRLDRLERIYATVESLDLDVQRLGLHLDIAEIGIANLGARVKSLEDDERVQLEGTRSETVES